MITILVWLGFAVGGWVCLLNFYLSFLRYPLHRCRGLPEESYRWVSGVPVLGSLFVALSLFELHSLAGMLPVGIGLIAIDTGGIHWFVGSMIHQALHAKKSPQDVEFD